MFGRRMFLWSSAAALIGTATACSGSSTETPTQPTNPPPTGPSTLVTTDLVVGEGAEAVVGSSVFIHYTLWHYDPAGTDSKGAQIDTSRGRTPFGFVIGSTSAITGISQGVAGMKVGGQRRLIIPPSLAYGSAGNASAGIQPNEWIVFEVELLTSV